MSISTPLLLIAPIYTYHFFHTPKIKNMFNITNPLLHYFKRKDIEWSFDYEASVPCCIRR